MKKRILLGTALSSAVLFSAIFFGNNFISSSADFSNPSNCKHANTMHHDEVEATYYENGVKEYWGCCDCHSMFDHEPTTYDTDVLPNTSGYDPYDSSDGRHLDKKLYRSEAPVVASNTEVAATGSNALPSEYTKVYKYSAGGTILGRFADVRLANFNYVKFAVRSDSGSGKWFEIIDDFNSSAISKGSIEASSATSWTEFSFTNNNNGTFTFKKESTSSSYAIKDTFSLDNLKLKFNGDWYLTELVGEMKDKTYISPLQKISTDVGSFMSSGTVLDEKIMVDSNLFSDVKQKTCAWSGSGNPLADVDLTKYDEVFFKYYCDNQYTTFYTSDGSQLFAEDKTGGGWSVFKLLRQEDGTFNIEFRNNRVDGTCLPLKDGYKITNLELTNLNQIKMKTASAVYKFSAVYGIRGPAQTNVISTNIFEGLTNVKTTSDELYPDIEDISTKDVYTWTPIYHKTYQFVDVNLSLYDHVFFYYRTLTQGYFTITDKVSGARYIFEASTGSASTEWSLFEFVYDSISNSWSINSPMFKLTGLEIDNINKFNIYIDGNPQYLSSPIFAHNTKTQHTLNPHTLAGTGYEVVSNDYINFAAKNIPNGNVDYILADGKTTQSRVALAKSQVTDIRFNDIDLTNYSEVYFKVRRLECDVAQYFELGTIASGAYKDIVQTNKVLWQEITLKRVEDPETYTVSFDVYINGTKKVNIASLSDLHFKLYGAYVFSQLLGKVYVPAVEYLIKNDLTTDYKVSYISPTYDRYIRHSASVLVNKLNEATGKTSENGGFVEEQIYSINTNQKRIIIGEIAANTAGFDTSDLGGLDYKIVTEDKCIFIFGASRNGTHNGVQAFLNRYCGYEYFYKGVENLEPITSEIPLENLNITENFDFDMAWDVQAETRYDYSTSNGASIEYDLDAGFMIDYASEEGYKIDGGWHNENDFHTVMNVPYVTAGKVTNHVNLDAQGVDEKVATYLYDKYGADASKTLIRFSLNDDYAWYNTTDDYQTRSNKYFKFMNSVAEKLDAKLDHHVYLVTAAYHFTEYCPTDWVPYSGDNVDMAVFYCPSNITFCAEPDSEYNDRIVKTWNHMTDKNDNNLNPYQNWLQWAELGSQYNLKMFVYLYNSLSNYFAPFDVISHMSSYYKLCRSTSIDMLYDQGQYSNANATNWARLKTYLNHKLSLDADANVNDLTQKFMKAYFGDAWEAMYNMLQQEIYYLNNPTYYANDYADYYGNNGDEKTTLPLQLRGKYWGLSIAQSSRGDKIFVNDGTGMLDYYDAALAAAGSNSTIVDRIRLEGLAIRYWYVSCCLDSPLLGYSDTAHKINGAKDSYSLIKSDGLALGVKDIGENLDLLTNDFTS